MFIFLEELAYFVFLKHPFSDSLFFLITDDKKYLTGASQLTHHNFTGVERDWKEQTLIDDIPYMSRAGNLSKIPHRV